MAEPAGVHPHRRSRTQSDNASVHSNTTSSSANVAAPGAPRIGTGNWGAAAGNNASAAASQENFEELLDTVVEGDSYDGAKGLGIENAQSSLNDVENGPTSSQQHEQDELMESVAEQHVEHLNEHDSSNDTFELDLDQAFNEAGNPAIAASSAQAGQVSMQIDGKSILVDEAPEVSASSTSSASIAVSQQPRTQSRKRGHSTSGQRTVNKKSEIDPDDWLALRATIQRDAERKVQEVMKDYREELDVWDISMVAEYSEEIFEYMEELEVRREFFCFFLCLELHILTFTVLTIRLIHPLSLPSSWFLLNLPGRLYAKSKLYGSANRNRVADALDTYRLAATSAHALSHAS